jgi:hypothetical protein
MNEPHFFVTSGCVINLNRVVHAFVQKECVEVTIDIGGGEQEVLELHGDDVGRFMLLCSRYHHFTTKEKFP